MKTKFLFVFALCCALSIATAKGQNLLANEVPEGLNLEDYEIPKMEEFEQRLPKDADLCTISFENATGYYVDLWIDKTYKGRITPWKRMSMKLLSKNFEVYMRTSGGTFHWYATGDCESAFILEVESEDD